MDNTRYDIANYNGLSKSEKDLFWIEEVGKFHDEVSLHARTTYSHISTCINEYLKATDEEKNILWNLFDPLTKRYSDYKKWEESQKSK
jgi:hypothetical protein